MVPVPDHRVPGHQFFQFLMCLGLAQVALSHRFPLIDQHFLPCGRQILVLRHNMLNSQIIGNQPADTSKVYNTITESLSVIFTLDQNANNSTQTDSSLYCLSTLFHAFVVLTLQFLLLEPLLVHFQAPPIILLH